MDVLLVVKFIMPKLKISDKFTLTQRVIKAVA